MAPQPSNDWGLCVLPIKRYLNQCQLVKLKETVYSFQSKGNYQIKMDRNQEIKEHFCVISVLRETIRTTNKQIYICVKKRYYGC